LLIDVVFIWFSDRKLFILTTLKNMDNSIWCSKEQNVWARALFSCKNDIQPVAYGDRWRIKIGLLVWYSSILQFKSTKLNLLLLPQWLCAIRKALVVHISARLAQHTLNTLVHSSRVSQDTAATCARIFYNSFIANFLQSVTVKKL